MSDCVVQMEMPKDCLMCPMAHWNKLDEITGCEVAPGKLFEFSRSKEYRESNTRPDWCPIICQLPEGHGRLVDADALNRKKKHLIKTENGVFPKSEWFIKANDLFAAKTIVPAERSEEK